MSAFKFCKFVQEPAEFFFNLFLEGLLKMDGKAGPQVATPFFQHQLLSGPLYEPSLGAKRCVEPADSSWTRTNWQHQQQQKSPPVYEAPKPNWNVNVWDWDSVRFIAKPADLANHREPNPSNIKPQASPEILRLGSNDIGSNVVNGPSFPDQKRKLDEPPKPFLPGKDSSENDPGNLTLKLGGSSYSYADDTNPSRQNKRVRSGSPGSAYPMCQVDDCRTDLTSAKDYHRRHKVCETHSKASKALVGSLMQRFCQQCSRFHPLQEFDEGKRSCRRRLAGHNRRRRKTQPEDALPRGLLAASQENGGLGNLDIVSLVSILSRLQGNNSSMEKSNGQSSLDGDQVVQLLNRMNSSFPSSQKVAPPSEGFDLNIAQNLQSPRSEVPKANGSPSTGSTTELLAILSALTGPSHDALALLRNSLATNLKGNLKAHHQNVLPPSPTPVAPQKPQERDIQNQKTNLIVDSGANNRKINATYQDNSRTHLPLRLFNSLEEDNSPPNAFTRKYFSSDSSNPTERSPSSSPPVVQNLFPLHSGDESRENDCVSVCKEDNLTLETSPSNDRCSAYELSKLESRVHNQNFMSGFLHQSLESRTAVVQPSYTSSSGSDQSPASSNSDSQERTGRIIFKLFGQHPSNFPVALRAQILEWLSHSPSDMESYIRPGCVILSIFVSMPSANWERLREDLPQRLKLLVEDSRTDFWRCGRVLVQAEQRLASSNDGKVRFCSSWRSWDAPEIYFVQPVAVVAGQETTITLRGHNLATTGTKILCAYRGKYTSIDVLPEEEASECIPTDSRVQKFTFSGGPPNALGRCFIEVEHGFKGNCFPVIVADPIICRELQSLESEIEIEFSSDKTSSIKVERSQEHFQGYSAATARDEVIRFLNELGWLFQKSSERQAELNVVKDASFLEFSSDRFKFLFIYAVERDMCALLKKLLDIFFEMNAGQEASAPESSKNLLESNLLHRAVKRNCKQMVDLLLNYAPSPNNMNLLQTKSFIFPPNLTGPGGLTPLHLAASIRNSEPLVDALTSDPQDVGLQSWSTALDSSGQTPHAYALLRNNHSYNRLVERKLADRKYGQVSITISNNEPSLDGIADVNGSHTGSSVLSLQKLPQSCAQCMIFSNKRVRRITGSPGALYRPYMHSILAIAAVCVCVCLYFHGPPHVGSSGPFKWENVDFGPA